MSEEENWQVKLADELHKPIKRNFTRRRVIANHIDEIWCSDLVEMQQFSKWNKGYRYLLMVLDVFSKYGWIVPLKDKKGETVAEAFKKIFKEGRKPQYLWTDKGKEYYNKHVKELLDKNKITLYSTENEEKSSVCERWNRTIKTQMWKQFTIQGNTMYLDMLPKILKQYNNTKHSSIKMTPIEDSYCCAGEISAFPHSNITQAKEFADTTSSETYSNHRSLTRQAEQSFSFRIDFLTSGDQRARSTIVRARPSASA